MLEFTINDLRQILLEGAGGEENIDLNADTIDLEFAEFGYDSLALMETAARINREYEIVLDDDAVTAAKTPRSLLELINAA